MRKTKLVAVTATVVAIAGIVAALLEAWKWAMVAVFISIIALIIIAGVTHTQLILRTANLLKSNKEQYLQIRTELSDTGVAVERARNYQGVLSRKLDSLGGEFRHRSAPLGRFEKGSDSGGTEPQVWPPHRNEAGMGHSLHTWPQAIRSKAASLLAPTSDFTDVFTKVTEKVIKQRPRGAGEERPPRVLLVSSNGAGLGHLTRLSAVESQLDAETLIYTMSSAYHRLGRSPSDVMYFPSHGDLGMDGKSWNVLMEAHFRAVLEGFAPDAIIFDGTYVYRGVTNAARDLGIRLVWMQRGCWLDEVDQKSKQRHNARSVVDEVIIPGDYGCIEEVDCGPEITPFAVPPITLVSQEDKLGSQEARSQLGLPEDKKLFLVQLGAGVINDISDLRAHVVKEIQSLGPEWEPVLVRNPLSAHVDHPEVLSIQAYPLGKYYDAFDAGAFAAGYNTAQEAIELGLPSLFVPNLSTKTDDQLRRAQGLEQAGLAICAVSPEEVSLAIQRLSDPLTRETIRESTVEVREPGGPYAAAEIVAKILAKNVN